MSVKNIVRNLFVSGALVLSGGVACSRPISADTFDELFGDVVLKCIDRTCITNAARSNCFGVDCVNSRAMQQLCKKSNSNV